MRAPIVHTLRSIVCIAVSLICVCGTGCVNSLKDTVPAQCLSPEVIGPSRDDLTPLDFTMLGQKSPASHVIAPDDILGIHIEGVLGDKEKMSPDTHFPPTFGDTASGNFTTPAVGIPITVLPDGTIRLPHVAPIKVSGLTLVEAREKIRADYTGAQLLQPGRDVITVTLMKARVKQVLVLREDSIMNWPILKSQGSTLVVTRGNAKAVDMPVYQNDVLHALTLTGGLPGSDATNEIWVLHGAQQNQWEAVAAALNRHADPAKVAVPEPGLLFANAMRGLGGVAQVQPAIPDLLRLPPTSMSDQSLVQRAGYISAAPNGDVEIPKPPHAVRIPLKLLPGQNPGFTQSDVLLESGDVVYIPSRDAEHYFTGGVLLGQQLMLPRDYELDVIGAIAIGGGSTAGPPGWNSASGLFSKQGSGPGVIVPPTRVIILRKLPGGGQVRIHVDLKKALYERKERLPIRPGDVILLQFTPGEIAANYVLNALNFNATLTRSFFTQVP